MEDTLQRVFSILLSVMIFFLLPLYMAFEKKDDISYSLALKITSNFVDEVCNKGYITMDMYNDFISDLSITGNAYDVKLEHISNVYEPVIYAYKDGKQYDFDYNLYKKNITGDIIVVNGTEYNNATLSYKVSKVRYSTDQMLKIMDQDAIKPGSLSINQIDYIYNEGTKEYNYSVIGLANLAKYDSINISDISPISGLYRTSSGKSIYPMNKSDKFNIQIKNTNITIASILFNTLTFGANTGSDTKVYINYGGTIKNEEYRNTVIDTDFVTDATDIELEKTDISPLDYDINKDGKLNLADAREILNYYENPGLSYTSDVITKMDINKDGEINTTDVTLLNNIVEQRCDLNNDSTINTQDLNILQSYLDGTSVTEEQKEKLDINGDSNITIDDINVLKEVLAY